MEGKLSLRFTGLYEVLECVGPVAYRLALLTDLSRIHNIFHVSILKKYRSDLDHIVQVETLEVESNLSYEEELVQILASEVEEAAWEMESSMREQYPHLFGKKEISGTKFLKGKSCHTQFIFMTFNHNFH
ncbi:receptor-like protein kinase [Gossypium australe]|uniref:Receptor-like protein kinase n=1 Tax=Gossypium australe TaxID=47621 RepID=A0A5B6VXT2_9ROSI|nr:receptor-like protein kinase [Gossypium australe]